MSDEITLNAIKPPTITPVIVSGELLCKYIRQDDEKPSRNPLPSIINPDAIKQKYVNPEINIKNKYLISNSESTSAVSKLSENVSHPTKMLSKCCRTDSISKAFLSIYEE